MSDTEAACPSCRTPLLRAKAPNGLRFQCATCHGVIMALAVFRRVLTEGVGSHVWVASASQATNGHPCGFCTRGMRPTGVPVDGTPAGIGAKVEVCRPCEAVWVPGDQSALLPTLPAAAGAPLEQPTPPTRCPECGAPFETAADGCCPYCHRRVEQEPQVIFVHDSPNAAGASWHGGGRRNVMSAAAGMAIDFLLGG